MLFGGLSRLFDRDSRELVKGWLPNYGVALFILLLGIPTANYFSEQQRLKNNKRIEFELNTLLSNYQQRLHDEFRYYEYALTDLQALVNSSDNNLLSYDHFVKFSKAKNFTREFPNVTDFGIARFVTKKERVEFEDWMTDQLRQSYTIAPISDEADHYFAVQYINTRLNLSVLGFNFAFNPVIQEIALNAALHNNFQMTPPMFFDQSLALDEKGFLIFFPMYEESRFTPPDELNEKTLIGWSYARFLGKNLINALDLTQNELALTIRDVSNLDNQIFFQQDVTQRSEYHANTNLKFYNRHWVIELTASKQFIDDMHLVDERSIQRTVFAGALLLAALAFFLVTSLSRRRQVVRQSIKLDSILSSVNEAIISLDTEDCIISWNPAAALLFGYSEEEALGRFFPGLVLPDDKWAEYDMGKDFISKGQSYNILDTQRRHKEGHLLSLGLHVTPMLDKNKRSMGVTIAAVDISHVKRTEKALQRSNEELEEVVKLRTEQMKSVLNLQSGILNSTAFAVIATDLEGLVTFINPATKYLFQFNEADVIAKPDSLFFADELGDAYPPLYQQGSQLARYMKRTLIEQELIDRNRQQVNHEDQERIFIRKDLSRFAGSLSVSLIHNDQGESMGYLAIVTDLTRQKYLEFEWQLEKVSTESTSDAVLWMDDVGAMIKVNQAACDALGVKSQVLLGRKLFDIFPDHSYSWWRPYQIELQQYKKVWFDTSFHNVHGEEVHVSVNANLIYLDGKEYVHLVARDINDRLKKEHELATAKERADIASEAKSHFLANMSHELRTPMNAVIGLLELVKKTSLSPVQSDFIDKTQVAAHSLLKILNDILDFSKIEANSMLVEKHEFQLSSLIDEMALILSASLTTKDIEVLFDIDDNLPETIQTDALKLKQILLNLGSNAIKFTQKGHVLISIKMLSENEISMCVEDSGIGMNPEQLEHIFTDFKQAEASINRRFGGTGLGLAITKKLIELMDGSIRVESHLGKGTSFHVQLPLEVCVKQTLISSPDLLEGKFKRVLIVDDDNRSIKVLEKQLMPFACDIDSVQTGLEAIAKLTPSNDYDLVILDYKMPAFDGLDVIEQVYKLDSYLMPPCLLMVTAYDQQNLLEKALVLDNYGTITLDKPVTKNAFHQALSRLFLSGRQGQPKPLIAANDLSKIDMHTFKVAKSSDEVFAMLADDYAYLGELNREPKASLFGINLLLVEDNPINSLVAAGLLKHAGANVVSVESGVEALSYLSHPHKIDLILMDIQMPDFDGYQTSLVIRNELESKLPIIAMTANIQADVIEHCLEVGMNAYIPKPFDLTHLIDTILEVLEGSRL
ncbi:probable sensor/response regulator hybrid [Marinomonas sp. MED121]|uniref:CHASE domain-containing hybrid sensor histidine kinase/response regulator n=1 Tax=Marinomonas sp. MED121 TaxID=314277 RepID=UPI0000690FC1|nr:PAS domain S-box protein [Marinomonas sp. MED121]EAQ67304.1 probable sensor/response regulator hybrid [Marinomonas sp. MED121]